MDASLKRSAILWHNVKVRHLHENMRAQRLLAQGGAIATVDAQQQQAWADYLQRIGEGTEQVFPEVGEEAILIPEDMCCQCRNPSFGLATKAKGLQGCGPRGSPGVTSETPENVGECEGVGLHTPKATPKLGEGVPMDSRWTLETSESDLRGQISMAGCALYINGKLLKRRCLKWARIAHLDI